MINHHFSHLHASFWLRIEQRSNRRRNLALDESAFNPVADLYDTRTRNRSKMEKWNRFMAPVCGCVTVSWVLPWEEESLLLEVVIKSFLDVLE